MVGSDPILFDEVSARLPLFENLRPDAIERLGVAGLGRGLLTASVRARLRKAGFVDMAALALATPVELMKVRKIGPARTEAIRDHLLGEIARMYPGARNTHAVDATAARRLHRLRARPAETLPIDDSALEALGCAAASCATLASRGRSECLRTRAVTAGDIDRIVVTLVRFLLQDKPRPPRVVRTADSDLAQEARARERASALQQQNREWDEAAPNARVALDDL